MKFGIVLYRYTKYGGQGKTDINIGDAIQAYSTFKAYRKLGISDKDIVFLNEDELETYEGERVKVLFNLYGGALDYNRFRLSKDIVPVFWGFNYAGYVDDNLFAILKKNEPIGCRDKFTKENLKNAGIDAFISGCITLTLPKRTSEKKKDKVFFVDTPNELESYIPSDIKLDRVNKSHIMDGFCLPLSRDGALEMMELARRILVEYKENARLVVSGRLHCASPCIAMGIPVIIAKKNRDINMSWIEKISHVYVEGEFERIDWNLKDVNVEPIKQIMLNSIQGQLFENERLFNDKIDAEFDSVNNDDFNDKLKLKLEKCIKTIGRDDFTFGIWGLGDGGNIAYTAIKNRCPQASCFCCVDKFKTGLFHENSICKPEDLPEVDIKRIDYWFITTYSGRNEAKQIMNELHIEKEKGYSFLLSRVNGEEEYL